MGTSLPTLTVITPSFNHGAFIGAALDSVGLRPGADYQHIVVDRTSTDQTAAELASRPGVEAHIRPDDDSHEALNYALSIARGEVIGFLNADDRYEAAGLAAARAHFGLHSETQVLCGGMRVFTDSGDGERLVSLFPHTEPALMPLELTFGNPGFNSWFFRRSLLGRIGGFRVQYRMGADRDLLLRAQALSPAVVLPQLVYHYRMHEGSRTMDPRGTNRERMIQDHLALIPVQKREVWPRDETMRALLSDWEALERFKLVVRALRYQSAPLLPSIAATDWVRVPRALWLRRRWLRILFSHPHDAMNGEA